MEFVTTIKIDDTYFTDLVRRLGKRYGDEIGLFLAKRIAKTIKKIDDGCMSHFRVADIKKKKEVKIYDSIKCSGCCGSVDKIIEHYKTGRKFMYGFNYGH